MRHLYLLFKPVLIFLFFSIFIFAIYSNTFNASWHFDDRPNIVNNHYLHIDSLHPHKLLKTFFTDAHHPEKLSEQLYRPVSCLTFALNWYYGQDNVIGYHIVNTVIHVLTAFFLFSFILNLFNTPNLKDNNLGNPFFVAFLASILWASNPIHTQAVTYIVQRMAQLAALFYILGMLAYLKARLSKTSISRYIWFLACIIFYLLGVNSKPNAVMMPLAILLLEVAFFQNLADHIIRKRVFLATVLIISMIAVAGSAAFIQSSPFSFFDYLYNTRPFTPTERLLTQPRVVLFYISQIFYPMPDRFSIAHDVVLPSSLFEPWTTLPSILAILFLIAASLFKLRKWPILSFSILFFFLNHIIESSIIGLELIFEHRNYLPSFFMFLPVAYLLNYLLSIYKKKNIAIYTFTGLLIIFLVTFFSISTYIRNNVWKNDITLWQNAISKAPNDARPLNNLAIRLAWGDNSQHPRRHDMALKLLNTALDKNLPTTGFPADIYGNMGLIYFYEKNDPEKAFACFDKALKTDPENNKIRRDLVNALIIKKRFDKALEHIDILLSKNNENGIYYNLKGHVLLWQGQYAPALSCFKKTYSLVRKKSSVILNTSVALSLSGCHGKAEELLLHAIKQYPKNIIFYFVIIENSMRAGEKNKAIGFNEKMFEQFNEREIEQGLDIFTNNPQYAPISKEIIAPVILNSGNQYL